MKTSFIKTMKFSQKSLCGILHLTDKRYLCEDFLSGGGGGGGFGKGGLCPDTN